MKHGESALKLCSNWSLAKLQMNFFTNICVNKIRLKIQIALFSHIRCSTITFFWNARCARPTPGCGWLRREGRKEGSFGEESGKEERSHNRAQGNGFNGQGFPPLLTPVVISFLLLLYLGIKLHIWHQTMPKQSQLGIPKSIKFSHCTPRSFQLLWWNGKHLLGEFYQEKVCNGAASTEWGIWGTHAETCFYARLECPSAIRLCNDGSSLERRNSF